MGNLKRKAIKSLFWVSSGKSVAQVISWLVTIVLLRILSPTDYGLMGMAMAYQAILVIIYDLNLGEAILQKKDLREEEIDSAFWFSLAFGFLLYGGTWLVAGLCADFFSNERLESIIRVMSIGIVFLAAKEVPYHLMARNFEFKKRTISEVTAATCGTVASLIMAIRGFGVWSLVAGQVVSNVCLSIIIIAICNWKPGLYFSFSKISDLLKFALPVTGHYLLGYFCQRSDSIIVGKFLGAKILGYYTVAMDLSRLVIDKGIVLVNKVAYPVFARLQDDSVEMRRYFLKLIYLMSAVSIPMMVGMAIISKEIFILVISEKWLPALFVFRLFCILAIGQSYAGVLLNILKAKGKVRFVFVYSLLSAVLMPASFLVGVRFGLEGMAYSWLISYPILLGYLFSRTMAELEVRVRDFFRAVVPSLVGSVVMAACVIVVKKLVLSGEVSFKGMAISVFAGLCMYLYFLYIFESEIYNDIKMIGRELVSREATEQKF